MGVMRKSISVTSQRHENDWHVPNQLIERLLRAAEHEVAEVVTVLSPRQRGHLAVFCYERAHLQRIGLAVAATCDQLALMNAAASNAAGRALFAQSRAPRGPIKPTGSGRRPITLARVEAGSAYLASAADLASDEPDESVYALAE
jgi:hypothetical protein